MPAPTVPYKLLTEGLQIGGATGRGYEAQANFLVEWADAFTFADDIMGATSGGLTLPPDWEPPWRFPNTGSARLYAQSFTISPCGADGQPEPPNKGLLPGEFFTHAKIAVRFGTPEMVQQTTDDPGGVMQLDPSNPITVCEQSVEMSGKMVTRKGSGYKYESDDTPVKGDFAVPETEARIVLTFPRVPRLPWKQVRPYLGKTNRTAIFDCEAHSLLLEGVGIQYAQASDGTLATRAQLSFAYNHDGRDWNALPRPDGTYDIVYRAGDPSKGIFDDAEFREMFA
jgi:hypothetical protein